MIKASFFFMPLCAGIMKKICSLENLAAGNVAVRFNYCLYCRSP